MEVTAKVGSHAHFLRMAQVSLHAYSADHENSNRPFFDGDQTYYPCAGNLVDLIVSFDPLFVKKW